MNEKLIEKETYIASSAISEGEAYIDIETTGFSYRADIISVSLAKYFNGKKIYVKQLLATEKASEKLMLQKFLTEIIGAKTIIGYNSDSFDLPRLRKKITGCRLPDILKDIDSFDIYKYLKTMGAYFGMRSLKLQDVETFMGIERNEDFDYNRLKNFYKAETDTILAENILKHNLNDILNLTQIKKRLFDVLSLKSFELKDAEIYLFFVSIEDSKIRFEFNSKVPLIKAEYFYKDSDRIIIKKNRIIYIAECGFDENSDIYYAVKQDRLYPLIANGSLIYENIYYLLDLLISLSGSSTICV